MQTVKYRSMPLQILLCIVTFGFYAIYWFYQTAVELKALANDPEASPTLWTVLLFIPFGSFYAHYKYGELFERVSGEKLNKWILFLLWYVLPVAVWFVVQMDLNAKAGKPTEALGTSAV